MKISTIIIIIILITSLYYYTSVKYDVVATAGKVVYSFMKDVVTGNFAQANQEKYKKALAEELRPKKIEKLFNDTRNKFEEIRESRS